MNAEDTITWNQIELIHQYLILVGQLGMAWFAGAVTVNASVAWALLNPNINAQGRLVPIVVFLNDLLGVVACVGLIVYYYHEVEQLNELLGSLSGSVERSAKFPFVLFSSIAAAIGMTLLSISFAWGWAIWHQKVFDKETAADAAQDVED